MKTTLAAVLAVLFVGAAFVLVPRIHTTQPDTAKPPATAAGQAGKPAPATEPLHQLLERIQASPKSFNWGLAVAGVTVVLVAILLFGTIGHDPPRIRTLSPSFFFWLGMAYLALLLVAAAVFNIYRASPGPMLIGGILPIAVPWFGALGAVVISLEGVFLWNTQWDTKFNYWHIGRPLFGAVVGVVAFFIFIVILSAAGSAPKFLDNVPGGTPALGKDYIIFYVVAFLVGYREETFREMIKRATDLVLKPGTTPVAVPALTVKVGGAAATAIAFPKTAAGSTANAKVDIQNSGAAPLISPNVALAATGSTAAAVFSVVADQISGKGDLAVGQARGVELSFAPPATGKFTGTLTISASNLTSPKVITVSGEA